MGGGQNTGFLIQNQALNCYAETKTTTDPQHGLGLAPERRFSIGSHTCAAGTSCGDGGREEPPAPPSRAACLPFIKTLEASPSLSIWGSSLVRAELSSLQVAMRWNHVYYYHFPS